MANQYIEDDHCLETGKIVSWSGRGNALAVIDSLSYVVEDVFFMRPLLLYMKVIPRYNIIITLSLWVRQLEVSTPMDPFCCGEIFQFPYTLISSPSSQASSPSVFRLY